MPGIKQWTFTLVLKIRTGREGSGLKGLNDSTEGMGYFWLQLLSKDFCFQFLSETHVNQMRQVVAGYLRRKGNVIMSHFD